MSRKEYVMENNNIITKTDKQFGTVRCIEENGTVLYCASDVAKALGYTNPRKAILDHCRGVTKRDTLTNGGLQPVNFIPECDVYRLICHSKLPDAVKFEKWVFEDVVPKAVRGKQTKPAEQLTLETKEYHYFPKTWRGEPVITLADFSHFTGINPDTARSTLYAHAQRGKDYETLRWHDLAAFKIENRGVSTHLKCLSVITKSGVEKLVRYYDCAAGSVPMLEQKQETLKPKKGDAAEVITALGVLGVVRDMLKKAENHEAVEQINAALKYTSWELSRRLAV